MIAFPFSIIKESFLSLGRSTPPLPESFQRLILLSVRLLSDSVVLVYVRGIPPEATYTFKHALIRDAAYEALLKSRRQDLHRRFAEAISEKFAALAEEHPEILARHWTEAGDRETAISEWIRAGRVAEARYAFAEAQKSYNEALALVQLQPPSPDRDRREVEIRYQILATLSATRGHAAPETLDASERFEVVAEKSGNLRALFISVFTRGITAWVSGDLAAACQLADEAVALALRQESHEILASAYAREIWTRYWRGDLTDVEKYFAVGSKFFDSLPPTGQSLGSLPGFAYASWSAWTIGYANIAREREAQMMALVRTDHPYDLAYSAALAARLRLYMREFEQAEGLAARALEVARKINFHIS